MVELVSIACVQSASIQKIGSVVRGWSRKGSPLASDSCLSGAVAQLGERLICIQEVAGSIPTSSTTLALKDTTGL